MALTEQDGYDERLQEFTGREVLQPRPGPDPVNVPMIRHWVEAMGDRNPIYLDETAARETGRAGIVAPASMTQAWTMPGYAATAARQDDGSGLGGLIALLAEGGYTSVVATDSEFAFHRELVVGDHVGVRETVESISPEKRTALGAGRFVTTRRTYLDQHGEVVAEQRWRMLWFRPEQPQAPKALRPRPAVNRDNAFWFEAAREHRLVIQRCSGCAALRHPPGPCCPRCGSYDWDTAEASGRGRVHSFVVSHHPRHPAFESPYLVALVELEEGTRLVANLVGVTPEEVVIDMPVALEWLDPDPGLTLPAFRPVTP
ncbi:bifunctional MaoC family dehydratase N-terminal/OB-fold nucleic acid binding domain-containing protein [Nonomuraea sp. MCN248]|uniref:Bifunctional MaoC family dehydratase N-terminal/OB-fold nucleic acid binding domain-containing protein n=1 Tax=Nonomuraea corallina TaxID=2989783 RepID=A0ABT4S849_9ACTN|nr:bifunctional MaoC family dehydratase N-terminal/OB-fold nucleic acid binding domain-containing protein [Nonomuraea corallina]MDA0633412.1 bifunctional MaoC family dehydratase N-terminal/OB-fold nucleic acid binding domain-containing protein [Nonomuraea corallina]